MEERSRDERITVRKYRNDLFCNHHPSNVSHLARVNYSPDSLVHKLAMTSGTNRCRQTIENNIVVSSRCREYDRYNPFRRNLFGSYHSYKTETELEFVGKNKASVTIAGRILKI